MKEVGGLPVVNLLLIFPFTLIFTLCSLPFFEFRGRGGRAAHPKNDPDIHLLGTGSSEGVLSLACSSLSLCQSNSFFPFAFLLRLKNWNIIFLRQRNDDKKDLKVSLNELRQ